MVFEDRRDAGERLGKTLAARGLADAVVYALPRGGVPVAFEVAQVLDSPLEVLVARKLGVPGHRELGFGAIAEGGVVALNRDLVDRLAIPQSTIEAVADEELHELNRRVRKYRGGRRLHSPEAKTAVLVDDGLATGYTARAGIAALRAMGARRVVLAIPVGAPESVAAIEAEGTEVVCIEAPQAMMAVGQWYRDFDQTSDDEVLDLLNRSATEAEVAAETARTVGRGGVVEREVHIPAGGAGLEGTLVTPASARGVVVFAHGSGSSRKSPRNVAVARYLNERGLATLLIDLLTPDEAADRRNIFDIELLASRLESATDWLGASPATAEMRIGFFGASTGGGAALVAAARLGPRVDAVVSRGGRPDLAGEYLPMVVAPTLLLVGERDIEVLELNRLAQKQMECECHLAVVPGATHLFEEAGTLEEVALYAGDWFVKYLT